MNKTQAQISKKTAQLEADTVILHDHLKRNAHMDVVRIAQTCHDYNGQTFAWLSFYVKNKQMAFDIGDLYNVAKKFKGFKRISFTYKRESYIRVVYKTDW